MTVFVVVVCLVALLLGFVAGVVVAEVAREWQRRKDACYYSGPHPLWRACREHDEEMAKRKREEKAGMHTDADGRWWR